MGARNCTLYSAAVACLFALALALYGGSLRNPLVFDDGLLTEAFLRDYGRSWFRLDLRWFAYASLGWTYDLFGYNGFWLRLGNVLLHAATAAGLFVFLARLFGAVLEGAEPEGRRRTIAFGGAMLFLAHPVAVYGVAYLFERSIIMATFFSLLSLSLFLEGLLRGSRRWFVAAVAAYFVAVFSKEHAVALPAVAAALAVLVRGASWKLARQLVLPFALYAVVAVLVVSKQKGLLGALYEPFAATAIRQLEQAEHGARQTASTGDLYARSVANQALLYFRYLLTWLFPHPGWMSLDVRTMFPQRLLEWPYVAGLAGWLAYALVALRLLLRGGYRGLAGFALFAPWLLALPEMSTVRLQEPFVLYRSYLWMSLLPAALPALVARLPLRGAAALLAVAVLALVVPFADRLQTFSSDYAVWDDAVRKNERAGDTAPLSERAYRNRGVALYQKEQYGAALADFDRALALDPGSALAWTTRGTLYMRTGENDKALEDFGRALRIDPRDPVALGRRCVVLMRIQRYDAAEEDCRSAVEIDPYDARNHTSLGMVLALRGDVAAAEQSYRRVLELAPSSAQNRYQYGVLLEGTGRGAEAAAQFAAACAAGMPRACERARRLGALR